MRPFPRLRPNLFDALVALAVLALAAAVWAPLRRGGETEALTAVVYIDGEEADRWALASLAPDTHRRYSGGGYTVDYGMLMLGVLFCSVPTMIIFFVLQRQFAEGITGAVK